MTQHRQTFLIWLAIVLALAGCTSTSAWLPLLLLTLSLLASACTEEKDVTKDGGQTSEPGQEAR